MNLIDEDYSYLDNMDSLAPVTCKHCNWQGKKGDLKRELVNSSPESWRMLAGREGVEYNCPKCGWLVHSYYWKMS